MVYIQIARSNAWTSLDAVLPGHFKAHPTNVSMFFSKNKTVGQPLVLIAVAIAAKPLGDSSLKLQNLSLCEGEGPGRSCEGPGSLPTP